MLDLARNDDQEQVLPRPRLDDLGLSLSRYRMTVVVAGAGYGKSTLLRKWTDHSPAAIHTLTAADGEVATLARNLLGALRLRVPALARRQLSPLTDWPGSGAGARSWSFPPPTSPSAEKRPVCWCRIGFPMPEPTWPRRCLR